MLFLSAFTLFHGRLTQGRVFPAQICDPGVGAGKTRPYNAGRIIFSNAINASLKLIPGHRTLRLLF